MASTILAKMAVNIAANTAEFNKGLNQASGGVKKFTSDVASMGSALLTAFSIKEVASYALEVNKLAGTFDGVNRAFERLPNSTLLMENLRESTHGTVDQLTLMQQALRAKNFGISVKDLGTYLDFASIRAQQTGESIDYMVNSIILGLGRGSIKILDNLQVNIAKIKETVQKTGVSLQEAFRQQVLEQMKTIGGYAKTSATEVDQLTVSVKALQLAFAQKLQSSSFVSFLRDNVEAVRIFVKAGGDPLKMKTVQLLEEIEKAAVKSVKNTTDALKGSLLEQQDIVQQEINSLVQIIGKRNDELAKVNQELKNTGQGIGATDKRLGLIEQQNAMSLNIKQMKRQQELLKEYLQNLNDVDGKSKNYGITLSFLNEELDLLNEQFTSKTNVNDKAELKNIGDKIIAQKELIKTIEALRDSKKGLTLNFSPDLEAEGSLNPDLRNQQEANRFKEFQTELLAIGKTAEFAGGAVIQLEEGITGYKSAASEVIEVTGLVAGGIIDLADAFGQASTSSASFGDNILRAAAGFAQQFGAILIAAGIGKITFDKFKGPEMVAAGAALVAIGGAVRGTIANRPNLSNASGGRASRDQSFARDQQQINISAEGIVRGQDLYIIFSNYMKNNASTKMNG